MPDLYPYQVKGAGWLKDKKYALLADEMGLGKTPQVIVASDLALPKSKNKNARILVVCPAVVRENWKREFERFSVNVEPTSFRVFLSSKDFDSGQKGGQWVTHPGQVREVWITSYDLLIRNHRFFMSYTYELLVIDESHY